MVYLSAFERLRDSLVTSILYSSIQQIKYHSESLLDVLLHELLVVVPAEGTRQFFCAD